jgi:dipeptidyl aminopeptidase/acylaminoacyl peptidase
VYPVTDLVALDEGTHRFEAHYTATLAGPRRTGNEADALRYRGRSPLTHAASLRRPVLILHGDADPVVPVAQSLEFAARARAAGAPAEVHVYAGEGHGFRQAETKRDELARTEAFLARVVPRA